MDESPPSPVDDLVGLLDENAVENAVASLAHLESMDGDDRRTALRSLRNLAVDRPAAVVPVLSELVAFLADDERPVRLTAAKLFVAVARGDPESVVPVVPALADRLADDDEFYYVRARSAEALGYVALEDADAVASPEILANLRVGLSFDEPEVKEKLAKALEFVALGRPGRLRHQVSNLAEHLDDEDELVRYHLCTALVVVGCEHPGALASARAELDGRLYDESAYVRGRAAEALGLLAREGVEDPLPDTALAALATDQESFVAERARFALGALADEESPDAESDEESQDALVEEGDSKAVPDEVGTASGVRETTDRVVEEVTSPDGECIHCGFALPEQGPPMCPRCGAPR